MNTLLQDVRYGVRALIKRPGFMLVIVSILALGIGASTASFSVVDAVLIKPLPYGDSSQLTIVWGNDVRQRRNRLNFSLPDFIEYRDQNRSFESFSSYAFNLYNITGGQDPEQIRGSVVTTNFFDTLRVKPAIGKTFSSEEEASPVTVLSNNLWMRYFGGDPNIVGQSVVLNDEKFTIIGVMPPDFQFPPASEPSGAAALWVPLNTKIAERSMLANRGFRAFRILARLKPGMATGAANNDMTRISEDLERRYPNTNEDFRTSVVFLSDAVFQDIRLIVLALFAATGFVLLIACANVANLLLIRMTTREKEMAVRAALGASSYRLARQLLIESLLLTLLGGVVGLLLATWGMSVVKPLAAGSLPRLETVGLNFRLFAFNLALSILTGTIFGLLSMLRTMKVDLVEAVKEGGRGSSENNWSRRIRNASVALQVALALVVTIGASLMTKSFLQLIRVDPGFDPQSVLSMRIALPPTKYGKPELQQAFYQQAVEKIESLPGVESAGACLSLPPTISQRQGFFAIEGREQSSTTQSQTAQLLTITPGYLETLKVRLIAGRFFTTADGQSTPVVIVNRNLADHYFQGENPIGKRIRVGSHSDQTPWSTVIGLVGDVKYSGLEADADMQIYIPFAQSPTPGMYVVVRTKSDPRNFIGSVRNAIAQVDRNQPVANVKSMDDLFSEATIRHRLNTTLMILLAVVALILAVVGLYGVMSYSVNQRVREIGIRMAIGAQPRDILRIVLGHGLRLALVGLLIGLVGAVVFTRITVNLLYKVSALDVTTYAIALLLLIGVVLMACYLPARKASKVDPAVSLREQ